MIQEDTCDSRGDREGFHPLPVLFAEQPAVSTARPKHPSWVKAKFSYNERYRFLSERLKAHGLQGVSLTGQRAGQPGLALQRLII